MLGSSYLGGAYLGGSGSAAGSLVGAATITFTPAASLAGISGQATVDIVATGDVHVYDSAAVYMLDGVDITDYVQVGDSISDIINETPGTATLAILDPGFEPLVGQSLSITLDNGLDERFSGQLQAVSATYLEGNTANPIWNCEAIDDTGMANYLRPFGRFVNESATDVAESLTTDFSGFAASIESGLPEVTINFDGTETFMEAIARLAKTVGGYCKVENGTVFVFLTDTADAPEVTDGTFLNDPPMVVTTDESQLRTRVYGKGASTQLASSVLSGEDVLPLKDGASFTPGGGLAVVGVLPEEAATKRISYGDVQVPTGGALIGTGIGPSNAPSLALAAGSGVTNGLHDVTVVFVTASGRSLPSPVASITSGVVPPPTATPGVTADYGWGPDPGNHRYAMSLVTAAGETTLTPVSGIVTTTAGITNPSAPSGIAAGSFTGVGSLTPGNSYSIKIVYADSAGRVTLASAATATVTVTVSQRIVITGIPYTTDARCQYIYLFVSANGGGGPWTRIHWGDYAGGGSLYDAFTNSTGGGTFDAGFHTLVAAGGGPAEPTHNITGVREVRLTNLEIPTSGLVTIKRIYGTAAGGSTYKLAGTVAVGSSTATITATDAELGADAPSTNTATAAQIAVASIPLGSTPVTARELYMSAAGGGGTRRRALLISNNSATTGTITMSDATLAGEIAEPTSDTSLLPQDSGQVNAGSTEMPLATAGFPDEGWAEVNGLVFRYGSKTGALLQSIPASGVGSLTVSVAFNSTVRALPILTGCVGVDEALEIGATVQLFVQVDDVVAQTAKIDRDGGGTGIVEYTVTDERRSEVSLTQLCQAHLNLYGYPIVTAAYDSLDIRNKSGKTVNYNVTVPALVATLVLQSVSITDIDVSEGVPPRFSVVASNVRFSVEDQIRRLTVGD
jgi:hypothetical protein